MNKKEIIQEILGEDLFAQGYEYVTDDEEYVFRKREGRVQVSFWISDIYKKSLKIWFGSNIHMSIDATKWVDRNKCRINVLGFCDYDNESEFREIILEAKRIYEQYGEETFQELSVLPVDVSTPEMEQELYEKREELNEQGIKLLGIEGVTGLERIYVIIEKLKELQNKPFQEVISDLMVLSAVYGSIYCEMTHGEWLFDGERVLIKQKFSISCYPLKFMIKRWKNGQYQFFISECEYAETQYNRWKNSIE